MPLSCSLNMLFCSAGDEQEEEEEKEIRDTGANTFAVHYVFLRNVLMQHSTMNIHKE